MGGYFRFFILCIGALSFSACYSPGPEGDGPRIPGPYPYECLIEKMPETSSKSGTIGERKDPLYGLNRVLWARPDHTIPVCWEPLAIATTDLELRNLVRAAAEQTWNWALDYPLLPKQERVRFSGWSECEQNDQESIHIGVADVRPNVARLGSDLAGIESGMTLNFTFNNWSPVCQKELEVCIWNIAVHEFGHALGLSHEQNRSDTDRNTCNKDPQGENGDLPLGPWDSQSVMNYCNPHWNNDGALSQLDRIGVQALYYPNYFIAKCLE